MMPGSIAEQCGLLTVYCKADYLGYSDDLDLDTSHQPRDVIELSDTQHLMMVCAARRDLSVLELGITDSNRLSMTNRKPKGFALLANAPRTITDKLQRVLNLSLIHI